MGAWSAGMVNGLDLGLVSSLHGLLLHVGSGCFLERCLLDCLSSGSDY